MDMLRKRGLTKDVPYVVPGSSPGSDERYVILPDEAKETTTVVGRPIGVEYSDVTEKLKYMDRHGIAISVLSLANPWLDFLSAADATYMATQLNGDLQEMCDESKGRIYGFAVLPTQDIPASILEV
jgi:aminocarboxymuconate-semialdehyde decarboxylase